MLASLIAAFASGEILVAVRRARAATIAYLLAAICGLFGTAFLLVAGYIAAARRFGPLEAALFAGGGFLLLAILIIVGHRIAAGSRARRLASRRNSDVTKIAVAAGLAVLPALLSGRAGRATLVAPIIAALAYAIYRENSGPDEPGDKPD